MFVYIIKMFRCELCNYHTTLSFNYNRHLKSKRHLKNISKNKNVDEENTRFLALDKEKMTQNDPKMTQNDPKMTQNDPKKTQQNEKIYLCSFCDKSFS